MLFFLTLIISKFQLINEQEGQNAPIDDNTVSQSESILTEQPLSLDEDSSEFLLRTFSKVLFVPKSRVKYDVDYYSGKPDNNYHGNFWDSENSENKIEFFSQSGVLLSYPNEEYYCDDVQQFPKTLTGKCLPGTKDFNFGADGSPLKAASGWKLVSGDPNQDCGSPTYSGSVQVRGRLVWDYFYVEREWMFEVVPEDQQKIFKSGYRGKFQLLNSPTDLQKQLASATLDRPVKITVKGLAYYCEGAPGVSVTEPTKDSGIYPLSH
jgi:hypothetical protein